MAKRRVALMVFVTGLCAIVWISTRVREPASPPPVNLRGTHDPLTIAFAGDILFTRTPPSPHPALTQVTDIIAAASLSVANLEVTLLEPSNPLRSSSGPARGPLGGEPEAAMLARFGFNVLSRANNHGADFGRGGIEATGRLLRGAGILSAGAGDDLDRAREPVIVSDDGRRVAVISTAISVEPDERATRARGESRGRPGVSALRYVANITADPVTYQALMQMEHVTRAESETNEMLVFGTRIRKGAVTAVDFDIDTSDSEEVLEQVSMARAAGALTIVKVHSHEPGNLSQIPGDLVREFARAAIDAGAMVVAGDGPHQLRGIEIYNRGVIFYSLGNFLFEHEAVAAQPPDVFDAGTDLYARALGGISAQEPQEPQEFSEDLWWEGAIAVAAFDQNTLQSVRVYPLDLGIGLPQDQRGMPRLAALAHRHAILERLAILSREFGTDLQIRDDVGVIYAGNTGR